MLYFGPLSYSFRGSSELVCKVKVLRNDSPLGCPSRNFYLSLSQAFVFPVGGANASDPTSAGSTWTLRFVRCRKAAVEGRGIHEALRLLEGLRAFAHRAK